MCDKLDEDSLRHEEGVRWRSNVGPLMLKVEQNVLWTIFEDRLVLVSSSIGDGKLSARCIASMTFAREI